VIVRGKKSAVPSQMVRGGARLSPKQRAAIEKKRSQYFELSCGHFVAYEVRELYRVFNAIEIFCEICDNWLPPLDHVTITTYPDIPLF